MRRTISLFTGVGGLDLGLEAAGFSVAVAAELNPEAVPAIRKNRDWPVESGGRPGRMREAMITTTALLATLQLLMVGSTTCAMSEETRCKKGGGVWRGTMCETPAR